MVKNKIGTIGLGVVGHTYNSGFKSFEYNVVKYDTKTKKGWNK